MKSAAKEDNLKGFLRLALTGCMDILGSKSGSIFLLDDGGKELILRIARGAKGRPLEGIRQRVGEGISGLVASERRPLLVKDINKDLRLQNRRKFNHYRTNSFICAPLMVIDRLIGVININGKTSRKSFNSKDLELLSLMSDYIAIATFKLKLSEKLKAINRQLRETLKAKDRDQSKLSLEKADLEKQIGRSKKFASLGSLVAGMAHELNNPLDGVIRYTNLSLECVAEDGIVREYLLEAKKGLNRITKLVRSLLDFARASSPSFKPIDVNKAIEDSLLMMNHYILSNNIEVIKQFDQGLPILRDNGLKLVFTNLLKNACDAMPKGGKIEVYTEMKNGFLEIGFSDTGPGIPGEIRGKIFEPFFTTKEMGKGSGLGLAICYDIIQKYNGKIFLQNKKGKGETFIIQLSLNGANRDLSQTGRRGE